MQENSIMPPGLYNMDCMEAMRQFPDGYFQLAIVDPPYGGGAIPPPKKKWGNRSRFGGRFDRYHINNQDRRDLGSEIPPTNKGGDITHWDVAPPKEYFDELFRVSQHAIIWGGNYFGLPPARCFVVWDKKNISENFTMAMCEYAWTDFHGRNAKLVRCVPQGTKKDKRFHPTQKPVPLYEFCLKHFAKPGDRILDTHAGSASLTVACMRNGFDCWSYEIDKVYYDLAKERIGRETHQMTIDV